MKKINLRFLMRTWIMYVYISILKKNIMRWKDRKEEIFTYVRDNAILI